MPGGRNATAMALLTEAAYMFAALHELYTLDLIPSGTAPHFPSQWEEGSSNPFDAKVDSFVGDAFLQFKRSTKRVSRRASEQHGFNPPFFQFQIYKKNGHAQHNALLDWAKLEPCTYYVAPAFVSRDELHSHFRDETVCENSICVPVSAMGGKITDGKPHYLYYSAANCAPVLCSDPLTITGATKLSSLPSFLNKGQHSGKVMKRLAGLHNELVALFEDRGVRLLRVGSDRAPLAIDRFKKMDKQVEIISRVLRFTLDLEWLLISGSDDPVNSA